MQIKLADNKDTAYTVADAVAENFNKMPENSGIDLLQKLIDNEYISRNELQKILAKYGYTI